MYTKDIKKIKKSSFNNPHCIFYSCNTATVDSYGNNFAYSWCKRLGGNVDAYAEQTDYAKINYHKQSYSWADQTVYDLFHNAKKYITASYWYPTGKNGIHYNEPRITAR